MTTETKPQEIGDQTPRPKNITGFIHYNDNDDQSKMFETLNTFRKEKGLKFSHHKNIVFFSLSSEYLGDLANAGRSFKISKFQTRSTFKCSKEVAEKLMSQKDSFLRMSYSEEDSVLTFFSRTTSRVHGFLVRRIFKDSEQTFVRENYSVIRDDKNGEGTSANENENEYEGDVETTPQYKNDGFKTVTNGRKQYGVQEQKPKRGRPKTFNSSTTDSSASTTPNARVVSTASTVRATTTPNARVASTVRAVTTTTSTTTSTTSKPKIRGAKVASTKA